MGRIGCMATGVVAALIVSAGVGSAQVGGDNVIASVEFVDTPITTVFKMVSDLTGWSIVMGPEVSKQPPKINIWIKNLRPEQVLEQVAQLGGLVVDRNGSTIRIMTFEEYGRIFGLEKRVLTLKHAAAKDVVAILRPYVEESGQSRIIPDDRAGKIVLLVPAPLLESLEKLVMAVDVPPGHECDSVEVVALKHLEAPAIVRALKDFLTQTSPGAEAEARPAKLTPTTGAGTKQEEAAGAGAAYTLQFMVEPKLNVVVLRGAARDIKAAVDLIARLDVPPDVKVISYSLTYTDVSEAFATLQEIVGQNTRTASTQPGEVGRLRIAVSQQNNRIVVEGSPRDHQRIAGVLAAVDRPLPPGGGVRVYRLENATAAKVAEVLRELVADREGRRAKAARQRGEPLGEPVDGVRRVKPPARTSKGPNDSPEAEPTPPGDGSQAASAAEAPASVIAAEEINAVIIKATAAEHEEFAELIRQLNRPRDQVMIEVTLVEVRSDNGFDLGLELGGARVNDSGVQTVNFTHFGIGSVDTATGATRLPVKPALGLSTAVFNSSDFSLVLNALQTVGDVRITSSPKLLVEDNSQAEISRITQEPFQVTDQGETTTTTTLGGFVDAGTILRVTPHLSEGDWLRLTYDVTFSSFASRKIASLPPPRLQNAVLGTVRVPAEHTIVLGGLVGTRDEDVVNAVPFLSHVPWVGELFKNRSRDDVKETLFVFIRPVILREPDFADLMYLSRKDIGEARLARKDRPTNPIKALPMPTAPVESNQ